MDLQELLDREEIRCLQDAYNIGGDRGRVEELAGVFAPDGVLAMRTGGPVGPEAIAAALSNTPLRAMRFVRHNLTTRQVVFDGPMEAHGRLYFLVVTDLGPDHMGVYVDRYVKREGAWKIAHRQVRIDWAAEGSNASRTDSRG